MKFYGSRLAEQNNGQLNKCFAPLNNRLIVLDARLRETWSQNSAITWTLQDPAGAAKGSNVGGADEKRKRRKKKSVGRKKSRRGGGRDQLYKNSSSRKIYSRRLFPRECDFPKTFSLTKNQFSGKTYFYTIRPWRQLYKIGLSGKWILEDYFQENMTSRRPFLLLRISFPGRPIFIQLPSEYSPAAEEATRRKISSIASITWPRAK